MGIGAHLLSLFEEGLRNAGCNLASLLTGKRENMGYYGRHGYIVNHDIDGWTEKDKVYDYYYNTKKVSLLVKEL